MKYRSPQKLSLILASLKGRTLDNVWRRGQLFVKAALFLLSVTLVLLPRILRMSLPLALPFHSPYSPFQFDSLLILLLLQIQSMDERSLCLQVTTGMVIICLILPKMILVCASPGVINNTSHLLLEMSQFVQQIIQSFYLQPSPDSFSSTQMLSLRQIRTPKQ